MKQRLIDTLTPLGYQVVLESTLAPDEYPDSFITFWNFRTSNMCFDNLSTYWTEWGFNIRFYSIDAEEVSKAKINILKAEKRMM